LGQDQSGNGYYAFNTNYYTVGYGYYTQNSRPLVSFDCCNQPMFSNATNLNITSGSTLLAAMKIFNGTAPTNTALFSIGSTSTYTFMNKNALGDYLLVNSNGTLKQRSWSGTSTRDGNFHIVAVKLNGSTVLLEIDGAGKGAGSGDTMVNPNVGTNGFYMGQDTSAGASGSNFEGAVGELILYNGSFTDQNRLDVEDYLGTKWGVTITHSTLMDSNPSYPPSVSGGGAYPAAVPKLWVDASYINSVYTDSTCGSGTNAVATNDPVRCFKDLSGTNNHLINTVSTQPVLSTTAFSGGTQTKGVVFTAAAGAATGKYVGTAANVLLGATNMTATIVFRDYVYTNGDSGVFNWRTNPGNVGGFTFQGDTAGGMASYFWDGNWDVVYSTGWSTSAAYVLTAINNGSTITQWRNGIQMGTPVASTGVLNTSAKVEIGRYADNGVGYATIKVAEALVFNAALNTTDRSNLETALGNKWGVVIFPANLPSPPLANPIFWMDASYSHGVFNDNNCYTALATNNGAAGCIRDLSGYGRDAIGTGATYKTAAFGTGSGTGNKNTVYFNGGAGYSSTLTNASISNYTVVVASNPADATTTGRYYLYDDGSNGGFSALHTNGYAGVSFSSNNNSWMGYYPSLRVYTPSTVPQITTFLLNSTTGGAIYVNGSMVVVGAAGEYTQSVINNASIGHIFLGHVGEMLIYNSALSDANRVTVETALGAKWGLTTAPVVPTPTIASPIFWVDASYSYGVYTDSGCALTVNTTAGTGATCWRDLSGNTRNAVQATAANKPTLTNNGISTNKTLDFDGSTDFMDLTGKFTHISSNYTAFFVVNADTVTAGSYLLDSQTGRLGLFFEMDFGFLGFYQSSYQGNKYSIAGPQILTYWLSNAGPVIYRNGDPMSTGLTYAQTVLGGTTHIGGFYGVSAGSFNGDMGEILIYNSALSVANRQSVETALATKWGMVAHPTLPTPTVATPIYWADTSYSNSVTTDVGCTTTLATAGSVMKCIRDLSGNGRISTHVNANGPVYTANGMGTRNTLRFSGNHSDILTKNFANPASNYTFAAVVSITSASYYWYSYDGASLAGVYLYGNANDWLMGNSTVGGISVGINGGTSFGNSWVNKSATPQIYVFVLDNTNGVSAYRNGAYMNDACHSTSSTNCYTTQATLLNPSIMQPSAVGDFGEMLIYNRALTTTAGGEVQTLTSALGTKWGITVNNTLKPPSGKAIWLDAANIEDDDLTLLNTSACTTNSTINGALACWKSKEGTNTVTTAGTAPTITANQFNTNMPGVVFNGSTNLSIPTFAFNSTSYTTFVVFKGYNGFGDVYQVRGAANNSGFLLEGGTNYAWAGGGWKSTSASVAGSLYFTSRLDSATSGGTLNHWVNGVAGTAVTSTGSLNLTPSAVPLYIGSSYAPTYATVTIGELIIYPSALSDANRAAVESYLKYKWGL
jgi:hypothetical protein